MQKLISFVDKVLSFLEDWILFIATMAALISLFFNVVLRYGFHYTLAWSEELVREVVIVTTFIGCSAAVKARSMIKIDALVQLVPSLKTFLTFVGHTATVIFSIMMIYYGSRLVSLQAQTNQKTIIMQIPLELLYTVLPVMGVMMLLRILHVIYTDIQGLIVKK